MCQAYSARVRLRKTHPFRLERTSSVARDRGRIAGCGRFVFNRGLALEQERFECGEKHLGYAALCEEFTVWRQAAETASEPSGRGSRRRASTMPSGARTQSSSWRDTVTVG